MGSVSVAADSSTMARRAQLGGTGISTRKRKRLVDLSAALVGLGFGLTLGLAIQAETWSALRAPGGWLTFLGRLAGLAGAYGMLVQLLLIARIPFVERSVGQDRLVRWHRTLGQWPVYLICLHVVFITAGYAEQDHSGILHQAWVLIDSYPDVLAAVAALCLILVAASLSIRAARRKMRYETWWTVHLYFYLALALAFSHQIANGASFVGHPLARLYWAVLWGSTAGVVLVFRVLLPVYRTLRHRLRVVAVQHEAPGVVSVVCAGRDMDRLGVSGGQFFQWRFLKRGMWWQSHPYSISASPQPPYIRMTVKALGDHSAKLARVEPGTTIAIEGPYGVFTDDARRTNKVLLIGAGVGMTSVRALLEDLSPGVDAVVVTRASTPEGALFQGEVRTLAAERGATLHELVGSRRKHRLDATRLVKLVPDIARRDLYVCGPESLSHEVVRAARFLGLPEDRIHCEQFSF
jgi:predicted ferric reductase